MKKKSFKLKINLRSENLLVILVLIFLIGLKSSAFTTVTDAVLNGESIDPEKLAEVQGSIKKGEGKISLVTARHANQRNIQLEIDTSSLIVKSAKDIQLPISNTAFITAVQDAIAVWEAVDIADIKFAPLKLTAAGINAEDGRNVITFRAAVTPPGVPAGFAGFTITTFARTEDVTFNNQILMVKPGTILDSDTVFDPSNNSCLAFFFTEGEFKPGGNDDLVVLEGGFDQEIAAENCVNDLQTGDLTSFALLLIGDVLGLQSSFIASSETSNVAGGMTRYALTKDDTIGLANLYPNKKNIKGRGSISGKIIKDKDGTIPAHGVVGAHVVLEDTVTGEPVVSTLTDLDGRFKIIAVPTGTYKVYVEPIDGAIKGHAAPLNFFARAADILFNTTEFKTPVKILPNKQTRISIKVDAVNRVSFNINPQNLLLTESEILSEGGTAALLPIKIERGETITSVLLWGDNISTDFGSLSVSGPGITLSNIMDVSVPVSPFVECDLCTDDPANPEAIPCKRDPRCPQTHQLTKEADQIPGISVDITCDNDAMIPSGPRNIIFRADQLPPDHANFNELDQISGGLIIKE